MKFEFAENEYGGFIDLKPENTTELAALIRLTKNAKSKKPELYIGLSDSPYCSIIIRKVDKRKQSTSISSEDK